jgi:Sec-independent protein translocase protein TatA
MSLTEILIIVVVILLIFGCSNYVGTKTAAANATQEHLSGLEAQLNSALNMVKESKMPLVSMEKDKPKSIEDRATKENYEAFSVCAGPNNETDRAVDCLCGDNPDITFAVSEFGAPGMDYKAFMASQELDPEIVKNHSAFVAERQGFTGRTFTPDSHDSYDPTPWVGLRRPEYVKVCSPKQEVDVDENLYKGNRQFCFKT